MKKLKVLRKDILQRDFPTCSQHRGAGVEAARPFLHAGSLNSIGKTLLGPSVQHKDWHGWQLWSAVMSISNLTRACETERIKHVTQTLILRWGTMPHSPLPGLGVVVEEGTEGLRAKGG